MVENFLSELSTSQKIQLGRYATVFVGGVAVGFIISKILESSDLDDIKSNVETVVGEYVDDSQRTVESVDEIVEDIIDEE